MKLKGLVLGTAVAIATLSALATRAHAQNATFTEPTVLETLDDIATRHSGTYSTDRSNFRQLAHFFGIGLPGGSPYPELELDRNSDGLLEAYNELMFLQTRNTPAIRVPDLTNPYNTSLQMMPGAQSAGRAVGTELNFEPLPRR
ncbi:hypothetical protein N836_15525 [Leptolyngbya sp. Heron Island J]|uniref:hypothetical protein n=1 Tax=Leptolyngbya sp. Heron Island J TaxID=1385935 RepID=UPI0003B99354|nr:hypothetical protein [Leptolyngbya sp. Heron Island J]ESA34828.1 hypothetical protein N836_15525 [Leptolyngbya sp. Heron Island J]